MSNLVAAPALLPIATALLLLGLPGGPRIQHRISVASNVTLLAVAVLLCLRTWDGQILVLAIGSWRPTVGIVWVADRLSATMLFLAALASLAVLIYAPAADPDCHANARFYPLHQLLLLGINGSFITGDLFNLFVFFEVMLVASFVLIVIGEKEAQLEQAYPYVVVNLIASMLLFAGVGLVYGASGTVNMAELAVRIRDWPLSPILGPGLVLIFVAFAIKAGLVPFFFWLPGAYPQAPLPVSAFFAGMLTKVGVYALFRTLPLFTWVGGTPVHRVLLAVAGATMLLGVLGALGRKTIRGVLSFHIISQVGYMVFGLALFTPMGVAAGFFYVIHHIVVKTALFLAGGAAEYATRSGELGESRGFAVRHPWLGVAFFVPAMALAGVPLLSGFWGKFFLVKAGVQAHAYATTAIAIAVSFLTLASMLKIWFAVYWGTPGNEREIDRRSLMRLSGPPLLLAGFSILMGAAVSPLYGHASRTAHQLLRPAAYIQSVLGATRPSEVPPVR